MAHILLVDDDEDLREAIESFLTDQGHDAATARDGVHALELMAKGEPPDIAVIDAYMPVMDGMELIERMRSDPRLGKVPIIMISASTTVKPPEGVTLLPKIGLRDTLLREIERTALAPEKAP